MSEGGEYDQLSSLWVKQLHGYIAECTKVHTGPYPPPPTKDALSIANWADQFIKVIVSQVFESKN